VSSATRTASTGLITTEGGSPSSLSIAAILASTWVSRAAPMAICCWSSARRSISMPRSSAVPTCSSRIEATC
jgi:hypothetical protein